MSTTAVEHADRQTRIADLAIHGWEPVFNSGSGRAGIWNQQLLVGFSVRDDRYRHLGHLGDSSVKHLNRSHRMDSYDVCSWDKVTDWHLDTIEARLEQT